MKKLILLLFIPLFSFGQTEEKIQYYESGITNYNSKNYPEAISDLTKFLENSPDENVESAFLLRASSKNLVGDYRGALSDYNVLIDFILQTNSEAKEVAVVYLDRGTVKSYLKDFEGAEQDFSDAIRLRNNYAEAFFNRGIIRASFLDKVELGCLDYSRAGELGIAKAYEQIKEYCKK